MNDTTIITSPEALRAEMVDRILAHGWARSYHVADAMRTVPRHLFVAHAPLAEAYDDRAVITKRGPDGAALSCASEPVIVAMMLDQLDLQPGHRVLEIGAGTGYNAALLAHITGPAGQVTTVDIDPGVTAQARNAVDTNGYHQVHVVTRDGVFGDSDHAPYDRIIVTVGAWDIPPAWWDQLTPGGRIVVPLRWRGQTRSVAFIRDGDLLRSDSVELCGFIPMVGQEGERSGHLDRHGQVSLHWDEDQPIDIGTLHRILDEPRTENWSSVVVGSEEPFDGIWLRLTSTEPGTCRLACTTSAINARLCAPAIPTRSPAIVEGASMAYLTIRRITPEHAAEAQWELGAIGQGPNGDHLSQRLCHLIHEWDANRASKPVATARRTDPDVEQQPKHEIRKRCIAVRIEY